MIFSQIAGYFFQGYLQKFWLEIYFKNLSAHVHFTTVFQFFRPEKINQDLTAFVVCSDRACGFAADQNKRPSRWPVGIDANSVCCRAEDHSEKLGCFALKLSHNDDKICVDGVEQVKRFVARDWRR